MTAHNSSAVNSYRYYYVLIYCPASETVFISTVMATKATQATQAAAWKDA
jgi:hypothetical protein